MQLTASGNVASPLSERLKNYSELWDANLLRSHGDRLLFARVYVVLLF